jgi:transposase
MGLEAIVVQHLSVARVAEGLGVSWNTANNAVLAEGKRVLIDDPHRFEGVNVIGVDKHVWRHTRRGDKYVTLIIDLTGVRDGTGPAWLLDMVEGRSKQAFKQWLAERPESWRDGVEAVAMDGFTVQDRHHRGTARRRDSDGSLSRRTPGQRRAR